MPCDQIRTMPLEFKPENEGLLQEVIAALNTQYGVNLIYTYGKKIGYRRYSPAVQEAINALPQAYGLAVVKKAAKGMGWRLGKVTGKGTVRIKATR